MPKAVQKSKRKLLPKPATRRARLVEKAASGNAARRRGDLFVHPGAATFTGKVDKSVNAKLAALPFVRSRKSGEGRCWWSVTPSGNYQEDYEQGSAWARLVMPLLKYNVGTPLLSWIIADMIEAGERNGLVLGFAREIGELLKSARRNLLIAALATDPEMSAHVRKQWQSDRPKIACAMSDAL